jgi:dienelactone hydrolase
MSFRNLSPLEMFAKTALEHVPKLSFAGESSAGFESWKASALPRVMSTLGGFPERVPLNPALLAEWEEDGLIKQKWLIDVQKHLSATCRVNLPGGLAPGERRPAILCWHGHGPFGKSAVMDIGASPALKESIGLHNYNYGHQMAQKGFVTFAIDWIGAGERNDSTKPNWRNTDQGRDWCNLYYLNATMLGMTSLSINLAHGMAATDFACSLPAVDADRLGVMGLSGGGTMALWSTLRDERFRATEIICYSDLWAHFGFRDLNYCGMQVAPGLYELVDLPDLQGLLAPRPLLVDIGAYDTCFTVDTAMACYRRVQRIYGAADAADHLELDLFPGEHGWGGNKSEAFFKTHLALS